MVSKARNLEDVFLVFLDNIGISNHCRGVVAMSTILALLVPKTFLLVVLVYFAILALVGGRLLVLVTRYVSRRIVSGFSPS